MKCLSLAAPLVLAASILSAGETPPPPASSSVDNDPSLFLGLTWTFGGSSAASSAASASSAGGTAGITLKILSTNERNAGALAAGVTYNFNGTFGCDIGVAWNDNDATLTLGYDLCQSGVQMGLGATKQPGSSPAYVPPLAME